MTPHRVGPSRGRRACVSGPTRRDLAGVYPGLCALATSSVAPVLRAATPSAGRVIGGMLAADPIAIFFIPPLLPPHPCGALEAPRTAQEKIR